MNDEKIFERAFSLILELEGGYVNDPDDPGGATKYGISKAANPDVDIENLTITQAKQIYLTRYWKPYNVGLLPPPIAVAVFACGVNIGMNVAIRYLQTTINWLALLKGYDTQLKVDGIIGGYTSAAAYKFQQNELLLEYLMRIVQHYNDIGNKKYIRGWIKRVIDTKNFIQVSLI